MQQEVPLVKYSVTFLLTVTWHLRVTPGRRQVYFASLVSWLCSFYASYASSQEAERQRVRACVRRDKILSQDPRPSTTYIPFLPGDATK